MWILLSLSSAFFNAAQMGVGKKLVKDYDSVVVTWLLLLVTFVLFLFVTVFTYKGVPWGNVTFLIALFFATVPYVFGTFLIVEATKKCDLSIVAPIMALTPIFLVLWEFLSLGTLPSGFGFLGIGLIVVGSYILNLSKIGHGGLMGGIFEPILSIFRRSAGLLPFIATFSYSFSAMGAKYALQYTDPFSFLTVFFALSFVCASIYFLSLLALGRVRIGSEIFGHSFLFVLQGGFSTLNSLTNNLAFVLANASYVIALKRTSALFGVALGYLIFKEKKIGERMMGAVVMVAGVAVLSVWG